MERAEDGVTRTRESAWHAAKTWILESDHAPGAEFRTADLYAVMGLEYAPVINANETPLRWRKRVDKSARLFATLVRMLCDDLLETHHIYLRATGRGSYEVIAAEVAPRKIAREFSRSVTKLSEVSSFALRNLDESQMSDRARRDRDDAMAHIDDVRRLMKRKPRRTNGK